MEFSRRRKKRDVLCLLQNVKKHADLQKRWPTTTPLTTTTTTIFHILIGSSLPGNVLIHACWESQMIKCTWMKYHTCPSHYQLHIFNLISFGLFCLSWIFACFSNSGSWAYPGWNFDNKLVIKISVLQNILCAPHVGFFFCFCFLWLWSALKVCRVPSAWTAVQLSMYADGSDQM